MNQVELCQEEIDLIIELDRRYRISMSVEMEKEARQKANVANQKEAYKEYG